MPSRPLPDAAQLLERIRDLEAELARLRGLGEGSRDARFDARLLESEERFRVAFATAPVSMSIARVADGKFLFVNAAFCRSSGYTEEEIIGRTFSDLGIYADEAERQRVFGELVTKGFLENDAFRFRTRAGELRHGLLSSRPITLGGELCQLGILVDVTDAKRAEAARAELEGRLRQAEKMEAIGRLAGGVAHDFNNLLTAVLANVEIAFLEGGREGAVATCLQDIREAATRAAELTSRLLAFSRKQVIQPRAVDVSRTVAELRSMLRRLIREEIAISYDLPSHLPLALVDPRQLEQIVVNLVVNARDAIAERGSITIATRAASLGDDARAPSYVVLTVADDGGGIAPDVLPHLFEPFFSTKGDRGTGLGLSTVDGIARQHGGFVEVSSAVGRGATFDVFLPVAANEEASRASLDRGAATTAERGVVILAEDDDAVRLPTKSLLEHLGFVVHDAARAGRAIELLREHPEADVLLTDLVMPEMNGRELAEVAGAIRRDLAIVTMSGYPDETLARGVLPADVVVLRKPFGSEQLLGAIRAARAARR